MKFTAIIKKSDQDWYVGQIEEVPAVLTQGKTIEELRLNLIDALQLLFETNRETIKAENFGRTVIEETILLP
jgi:predicted RNase H-like HicB family nuclease